VKRREGQAGDQLPVDLLAYNPDPMRLSASDWDAGFEAFKDARQQWADRHGIDVDDLPSYTVGDAPFDPTAI
jgi:lysophospholipase L1-like esterase